MSRKAIRKARITAVVLATSVVISIVLFVLIQKSEADKQRVIVGEVKLVTEQFRMVAEESKAMAEQAKRELEECRNR